MSIIQFNKDKTVRLCKLFRVSDCVIEIMLEEEIDTEIILSGFNVLNENNYSIQGEYNGYNTIYQSFDDDNKHYKLSNDGSVYVEPVIPDPEPEEEYIPTQEELEIQFQQNKSNKITLSKEMLSEYLANNPIHSTAHKNINGMYSVTNEKQTLMMSKYIAYQIEKNINNETKLTWNETGKPAEEWTEDEFVQLMLEIKSYVDPLVYYQQNIEEDIKVCNSQEELDEIVIDYYNCNNNV